MTTKTEAADLEEMALQAWGSARSENDLHAQIQVLHFLHDLRRAHPPAPIKYSAPKHLGVAPGPQYSYEPSLEPSAVQGWNLPRTDNSPDLSPDSPVLHTQLQERDAQVHAAAAPREAACGAGDKAAQLASSAMSAVDLSATAYGHFPPYCEPV